MDYELVVVWDTGDKGIYDYPTREEAEQGAENMKMANGNQIVWCGVRVKLCCNLRRQV